MTLINLIDEQDHSFTRSIAKEHRFAYDQLRNSETKQQYMDKMELVSVEEHVWHLDERIDYLKKMADDPVWNGPEEAPIEADDEFDPNVWFQGHEGEFMNHELVDKLGDEFYQEFYKEKDPLSVLCDYTKPLPQFSGSFLGALRSAQSKYPQSITAPKPPAPAPAPGAPPAPPAPLDAPQVYYPAAGEDASLWIPREVPECA